MKFIDKASLVIFSFIVLVLSMMMCFLVFGWVSVQNVEWFLKVILANNIYTNIALGVSIVFILLAVKCIYFMPDDKKEKDKGEGVLLENQDGKLLISKDTIENLVNSVAKGFESTQNVKTEVIIDSENKLNINVKLLVLPNTVITELSTNLQIRIKEVVKNATNLEINKINVTVKNIAQEKVENN